MREIGDVLTCECSHSVCGRRKFMEQLPERTKSRHFPGVFPFCHSLPRILSHRLPLTLCSTLYSVFIGTSSFKTHNKLNV